VTALRPWGSIGEAVPVYEYPVVFRDA